MVKMAADGCLNNIPFLQMTPPTVFKMKSFCLADQLHDTRDVHDKSCKILLFVELGLFIEGGGGGINCIYMVPYGQDKYVYSFEDTRHFWGFFLQILRVFF